MKKKKMIAAIVIVLIVTLIIGIIAFILTRPKKITGEEWFLKQETYVNSLIDITTNMDNVVSLYINGNINVNDYLTHMFYINEELDILIEVRNADLEAHPIKIGTHTVASKSGCQAIDNVISDIDNLIDVITSDNALENKTALTYAYLAAESSILSNISDYMASKYIIDGTKYFYTATPEIAEKEEK